MLTEDEIIQQIDAELNAMRDEVMFIETEFSVDTDAQTILSHDEDAGAWLVNAYTIEDGVVTIEPMPMMSFPDDTL